MNKISTGEPNGGNKEQGGGQPGINMNAIKVESEQPEGGLSKFNLRSLFNPADRRAKSAAEAARIDVLRQREEVRRNEALAVARARIAEASRGLPNLPDVPEVRTGASGAIKRIALTDPIKAQNLATEYVRQVQHHNDLAAQRVVAIRERQSVLNAEKARRFQKPISSFDFSIRPSILERNNQDPNPLRAVKSLGRGLAAVVSAGGSAVARPILAGISGEPKNSFDSVFVDDRGMHASAPFNAVPEYDIQPGSIGKDVVVQVNPAPIEDKLHAALALLPGINRKDLVRRTLIGTIEVRDPRGNQIYAKAPAWRPGLKLGDMMVSLARMTSFDGTPPVFMPEPDLPDLLGGAAQALGLSQESLVADDIVESPPSPVQPRPQSRLQRILRG